MDAFEIQEHVDESGPRHHSVDPLHGEVTGVHTVSGDRVGLEDRSLNDKDATGQSSARDGEQGKATSPLCGERNRGKKRCSWTDFEKKLIVESHRNHGRKHMILVAQTLGMPTRTADGFVRRAVQGKISATRDMRRSGRSTRQIHTKLDDGLKGLIRWLFTERPEITMAEVRSNVNDYILSQICEEVGVPHSATVLENDSVKAKFDGRRVRSNQTISNWLVTMDLQRETTRKKRKKS
mmetsp:Transcript_5225/g.7989  ORF Transcript_5225/g.7989 Transcript_5225/m.7989 type:complete len:237 (-) Transcript_5225:1399-2109(-)|eukprot:CAMPEP_0203766920 /NCGR_PEP_ID=MMETSP0099_2-20121227/699_1 /ASSEMBLY_ACC=CAM_ASM_000209 /TAXON_ID=96639 /ORGANISM=" , Strain NY0313808BC1" /LENGTH=236 /DNA_ID=CAMNT_0050663351 /DNA_START=212 /DNA_END=922 /DNA_ORIENTATION=-